MFFNLKEPNVKKTVIDMIKEYRKNIQPVITAELQKRYKPGDKRKVVEQTKFTWFSKEDMLALFKKNPGSTGVRIYFAAHKESTLEEGKTNKEYQGQLTVILVPTQAPGKENNHLNAQDMPDGTALDRGSLCRPDCPPPGTTLLFS